MCSLGLKYFPYSKFPETLEQLQEADVVLFGDVDPQRLSDSQLQIIRTFVEEFGEPATTRTVPPPGRIDERRLAELAAKYQIEIVGPPPV